MFLVEDGTGVAGANAYTDPTFVDIYLAERNRSTENGWNALSSAAKQSLIINATDYIEIRWGTRFKGTKEFLDLDAVAATATLTLTGQPIAGETVTLNETVYTFRASVPSAYDVLIGASASDSLDNLIAAVNGAAGAGTLYGTGTVTHEEVEAEAGAGDTVLFTALVAGDDANYYLTTETLTNGSFQYARMTGGLEEGSQPLSFPRLYLYDRNGDEVLSIPVRLQQATAEYAVRAANAELLPDPTIDALGGSVMRLKEVVGPIETETEYVPGTHMSRVLRPYPMADRLLQDYVFPKGRLYRG